MCFQHIKLTRVVSVSFALTISCPFLRSHHRNCPRVMNVVLFLFFHARDQCGQSRVGKMGPSCPLGQPIRTHDSLHLARGHCELCNKNASYSPSSSHLAFETKSYEPFPITPRGSKGTARLGFALFRLISLLFSLFFVNLKTQSRGQTTESRD